MYINKLAEKQEFSVFNQLCFILTLDFRFFLVCLKMEQNIQSSEVEEFFDPVLYVWFFEKKKNE